MMMIQEEQEKSIGQKTGGDDDICCSSCDETDDSHEPMRKKPKLWAHHLLNIVSPSSETKIVSPMTSPSRNNKQGENSHNVIETFDTATPNPKDKNHGTQQLQQIAFLQRASDLAEAVFQEDVQLAVWQRSKLPNFVQCLSSTRLDQSKLPTFYGKVTAETCQQLMQAALLDGNTDVGDVPNGSRLSKTEIEELIDDVHHLVSTFAAIIGEEEPDAINDTEQPIKSSPLPQPEVHVRLERLDDNGCVYWHQDTVPLRLVTTYRGPCTEYVDPKYSEETLRKHKVDSRFAQSLTHHDVAIFKGRILFDDENDDDDFEVEDFDLKDQDQSKEDNSADTSEQISDTTDNTVDVEKLDHEDEEDELPDLTSPGIVHRSPRIEGSDVVRLVLVLDIPAEFHSNDTTDEDENGNHRNGGK